MEFTYQGYRALLHNLRSKGYQFCDFMSASNEANAKSVIVRHDIDFSLECACTFSDTELSENVASTWFVLVNTDFYNCCSKKNRDRLKYLQGNGGTIGLHFDEAQYRAELEPLVAISQEEYQQKLIILVQRETDILAQVIQGPVKCISYHCPSQEILNRNMSFPGMVNAYSDTFFKDYKYLSDSSMNWREDVDDIVEKGVFSRLQILTHPIWYSERSVKMCDHLIRLCKRALEERRSSISEIYGSTREVLMHATRYRED